MATKKTEMAEAKKTRAQGEGRVVVVLHSPGYAQFKQFGLRGERFRAYRQAADGSEYVRTLNMRLTPIDKVPAILVRLRKAEINVQATPDMRRALQKRDACDWLDSEALKDRIARVDDELFKLVGKRMHPYQRTGSFWLARQMGALLADEMGLGKAQPISEPVLTPSGWTTIGKLRIGDEVIGADGRAIRVTGVFPQGVRECYRVTLTDGTSTRCDLDHLWNVETINDRSRRRHLERPGRVLTLRQILALGLRATRGNSRWFVPVPREIQYACDDDGATDFSIVNLESPRPLDPYLLGALLANGCLAAPGLVAHSGSEEQRWILKDVIPDGYKLKPTLDPPTFRIVHEGPRTSRRNALRQALDRLGVHGKRSWEKRIPPAYLTMSVTARKRLLAGLLDNDGCISADGSHIEYNTTSQGLAEDVLTLIRSLGCVATVKQRVPHYRYKDEVREGRVDYRIGVRTTFNPFQVPSKSSRFRPRTKYPPARAIEFVERCGEEESVCIRVDAADQLYVTKDFIVTHNTLEILVALPAKAAVMVCCPAVAKGDWRAEIMKWRPQMKSEVLKGRHSFRWPKPGEIFITNYDILPNVHDTEGVSGRVCNGKLPPKPCPGCSERIVFSGAIATTIRTGHEESCTGFLPPKNCPGCHPMLQRVPHAMVLVGDEAQMLKNDRSLRGMRWQALSEAVRGAAGRVWLATGTPLENEPPELWNVLKAAGIAEAAFGSNDHFRTCFNAKKVTFGSVAKTEWGLPEDEVKERLQRVMLRRLVKDVLPELPSITRGTKLVDIDPKALREIDAFLRSSKKTVSEIVELVEMQEVGFEFMSSVRAALASAKIPAMLEHVKDFEEKNEPLVVFSAHRAPIDVLTGRPGWVTISGAEDSEEKRRAADQFQNGYYVDPKAVLGKPSLVPPGATGKMVGGILRRVDKMTGEVVYPKGVAIMIQSGGVSLTLTRACHQLFVDRAWKPTANAQAEARTVRLNQTRRTFSKTLVADHPLDRRVTEVLIRKTQLIALTIDAAADGSDAPLLTEDDLNRHLREIQEAIACGHAVRRIAQNDDERRAVDLLHSLTFRNRSDERIASELAEEAFEVGLSNAQWKLAIQIAERGVVDAKREEEAQKLEEERGQKEKERRAQALDRSKKSWMEAHSEAPKEESEAEAAEGSENESEESESESESENESENESDVQRSRSVPAPEPERPARRWPRRGGWGTRRS